MSTYVLQTVDPARGPVGATNGTQSLARVSGNQLPDVGSDSPATQRATTAPAELHLARAELERFVREAGRDLDFAVDRVTGQLVISVRERGSGALIRQMPSEEALRIARNLTLEGAALVNALA